MKKILSLAALCIFLLLIFLSPVLIVLFPHGVGSIDIGLIWIVGFFGLLISWMLFATITPLIRFNHTSSQAIKFIKSKLSPDEKLLSDENVYFSLVAPDGKETNNLEKNLYHTDVKYLFWTGPNYAGVFVTNQRLILITKGPEEKSFETVLELKRGEIKAVKMHEESVATSEYSVPITREIINMLFFLIAFRATVPTGGRPPIMGTELDIETKSNQKYVLKLGAYKFLRLTNSVNQELKNHLRDLLEEKVKE